MKGLVRILTWGDFLPQIPKFIKGVISLIILFFLFVAMAGEFKKADAQDLGFDPAAPQGADWIGFKSKIIQVNGQDALGVTMSLVCVQGQAVLDTAGLTFNSNLQYYETPGILTMELKDAGGVTIATQTIDYWYINNSSTIDETDAIRAADPAWAGFLIPPGPDNNGTTLAPEMSQGYQDGMNFDNYEGVPLYLVLPPGTPSGNYQLCATGDFSYFISESNDPAEFPDFWCRDFSLDITTGETTWVIPPAPVADVQASYSPGNPVQVTIDGPATGTFHVERWTKRGGQGEKGGRNRKLNSITIQGNQFQDGAIEGDSELFWGARKNVYFYYKIHGTKSNYNQL